MLYLVWRKGSVPACWGQTEGCFVPKEKDSTNIQQLRTISPLGVEGKIFFSVLAKHMTSCMLSNHYINTSVLKGGILGFSGCVEHTGVLNQLLHEVRINHKDLSVIWLDLANAYGSIPHQLIFKSTASLANPSPWYRADHDLLQKLTPEVLVQPLHHRLGRTTEGHSHRMYHLCHSVCDGHESGHQSCK